jgi:DNA-binding CsgD family transcriptional regulator/tetratricopeptide (TPR) repeat protein
VIAVLLLERDRQLAQLTRWHEAIVSRGGCVVLVTGEAGIGKTAIVKEFTRRLGAEVRSLWGACDPLSTPQPLGPLSDVGRRVGGALLEALKEGTNRERIFAATIDELERPGKPVVLVIEDMHWADDATLDLIKYLGRRIARTRAMLIATYRSDEMHPRHPLQVAIGLLPGETVKRLPLAVLSEASVGELAETLGRSAAGLYAATGGNPFYVTELLAAPPGEIPTSVRDAVIARVARLSPDARRLAELVAAVPGHTASWLIQAVLHTSEAAIEEGALGGMMRNADESLTFRHELSRRAVEDSLTPAHARSLHARLLQVLRDRDRCEVSESRLVHHAVRAGDVAAVLEFAPRAAERSAGVGAHREAIAYYRTALRHAEQMPPDVRGCVLDSLAYECLLTGELESAIDARGDALAIWHAGGNAMRAGDTLRALSRLHWLLGRGDEAHRHATEAISALEPLGSSDELAMAFSNMAQLAMLASHDVQAIEWSERAIDLARQLGNNEILAHALNNLGATRLQKIGDAGWSELERSLELAQRCHLQEHVARAHTNLATFAIGNRNYGAARPHLMAGLAFCAEYELYMAAGYLRAFRARMNFERGAWTKALEGAEDLLRQPRESIAARIPALTTVGGVRTRRGADGALEALDEAWTLALRTGEPQRIVPVAAARAEYAWVRGDLPCIADDLRSAGEYARRDRNPWRVGELLFWAQRVGVVLEGALAIAKPFELQRRGSYREAAQEWARLGCPYEQALALNDSPDVGLRKRALEIYDSLGARPMAQRLRRQLKAEGVRGLKRGANRSTRANAAGLTVRELEVLALVAQDLSNAAIAKRLYLSAKTVDHHASAILSKLGIASRREAAEAAHKLGIELIERRKSPVDLSSSSRH